MHLLPLPRRLGLLRACLGICAATAAFIHTPSANAHGYMLVPLSRVYACAQGNIEKPSNAACKAAIDLAGTQAFYTWMGVNQANANGQHQNVVPDGKLCSGNNSMYRGLDLDRNDWQTTSIAPDANGQFEFQFKATAAHATKDWLLYVTRDGWSPTQTLKWSDLDLFCQLGNTPLQTNNIYKLQCKLPQRTGRQLIYAVWQRSDSAEAFYTCVDVSFNGTPNTTWRDSGPLNAVNALADGTTVTLRLFGAGGTDAERIDHVVPAGRGGITQWPYDFGLKVNEQSRLARIGVLSATGTIEPKASATANHVYLASTPALTHQVDFKAPDPNVQPPKAVAKATPSKISGAGTVALSASGSSDPANLPLSYQWSVVSGKGVLRNATSVSANLDLPGITVQETVTLKLVVSNGVKSASAQVRVVHQVGSGDFDYVYPAGIGSYKPGITVVKGSDGLRYRCKSGAEGGWCNIASGYGPIKGAHWAMAWDRL